MIARTDSAPFARVVFRNPYSIITHFDRWFDWHLMALGLKDREHGFPYAIWVNQ